jgi:hypothetical protein
MRTIVGFSFVAALFSCGGDEKKPVGPPVPIEQMASQMRQLICEKVFSCCSADDLKNNPMVGTDVASCVAKLDAESSYLLGDVVASVQQGRLIYHGDKLAECMAEVRNRSCDQAKMPPGDRDVTQLCAPAFEPQVPIGGACTEFWDCIGGWCAGDFGDLNDRCIPLQPVGGDCDEGPECQSGMCDDEDRVCQARPAGSGNICTTGTEVVGQHGTAAEGRGPP